MLEGLRDRYEAHHKVRFSDEALRTAATLADRYVTDRFMPDKAIDLMDEAAAKLRVALYSLPQELKDKQAEIEHLKNEEVVVHCRTGARGRQACKFLASNGFTNVRTFAGGIEGYLSQE